MLTSLFTDYLIISFSTSLLIVILLILTPLLHKRYSAKWTYWIWMTLAIQLLLPFRFSFEKNLINIQLPENSMIHAVAQFSQADMQPIAAQPILMQETIQPTILSPSLLSILAMIWVVGVVLFLIYHVAGYTTFRKQVLRWSRPVENKQVALWIKKMRIEMGISSPLTVLTSEKVPNPMLVGLIKPLLLLPHEQYNEDEWEFIIKHELVHFKRRDILYKLLLLTVHAFHWFNPFVWLLVREASQEIELYCDDTVVRKKGHAYRKQYCEAILSAMQKSNPRFLALSTNFLGGKNDMKQRFASILNMKKKQNGIILICTVVLMLGVLAACTNVTNGSNTTFKPGTIYSNIDGQQMISYDAGNTYSISTEGKVSVSYRSGEVLSQTPLQVNMTSESLTDKGLSAGGFFISEDKTAIVYNPEPDQLSPLHVLISDDEGKTWNDYIIQGAKGNEFFIGFTSKSDGWMVSGHFNGVGSALNDVYQTSDGGKTWEEIGNPNETYSENLTGAAFSNKDVGFLGFRYYQDAGPEIYWTKNRGKSWEKLNVALPDKFDAYKKTPLSPIFIGDSGKFPILLTDHETGPVGTIYLTSKDGGLTWKYDEADDKLITK